MNTEFTYGGKSWRIELWKGRYGISLGCEIGIYYKKTWWDFLTNWYSCSDVNYPMLSLLYLITGCNKNPQSELLFARLGEHWWLTGFLFNVTTPVVLKVFNNKLAMIGGIYFGDTEFAKTYNRNLQAQHKDEVWSAVIRDESEDSYGAIWVEILWGDVTILS